MWQVLNSPHCGNVTSGHCDRPYMMNMDDGWVRVLRPFNSISVISRRWKGEHERLCAMKRCLGLRRISPPAGFEPATPWTEVGSAYRSATQPLHIWWTAEKSRSRVFYSQVSLPTRIISGQAKCDPVEQIRRVFEDKLGIIFVISP